MLSLFLRGVPLAAAPCLWASHQFTDHITGKHVGFPESELATLFGFFRSAIGVAANARNAVSNRKGNPQGPCTQGGRVSSRASQRQHSAVGGGCSGNDGNVAYGADWTVAVACLRLLAKPKEAVLSSILGVFEVFARARGNRISHQRRLEQEKLERERQKELEEERERWKRRRRREQERGTTPTEVRVGYKRASHYGNVCSIDVTHTGFRSMYFSGKASVLKCLGTCVKGASPVVLTRPLKQFCGVKHNGACVALRRSSKEQQNAAQRGV